MGYSGRVSRLRSIARQLFRGIIRDRTSISIRGHAGAKRDAYIRSRIRKGPTYGVQTYITSKIRINKSRLENLEQCYRGLPVISKCCGRFNGATLAPNDGFIQFENGQ